MRVARQRVTIIVQCTKGHREDVGNILVDTLADKGDRNVDTGATWYNQKSGDCLANLEWQPEELMKTLGLDLLWSPAGAE